MLTNYCPISFLGTPYKILANTLANRLKENLDSWIVLSQTTFVQGRSIFYNVLMANEAISWAEESNQNLVILLLDFEKAFDHISWNFLQASMLRLGFDAEWISWVMALYMSVSAIMEINKSFCPKFDLHRSIKQGCPLAPYLFLLSMDVLGHMFID